MSTRNMRRRDVAALALGPALLSQADRLHGESAPLRIDVHSHFLPDEYLAAMREAGVTDVDGFPLPRWTLGSHLAAMDKYGVSVCLLSVSSPGLRFARPEAARRLARSVNHTAREIVQGYPRRFGAFSLLPLPDVEGALSEIAYALDVLKLDGIGLYSNYDGAYLGAPQFNPVFDELNRRKAVVFVHPTQPPGFVQLSLDLPAPVMEYPFDSTRMVANLIRSGTITRCPDLRVIVPHGGGTIPYLAPRMSQFLLRTGQQPPGEGAGEALAQLKSFYFDLTAATHPAALAGLRQLVPPAQILSGFDFPFMPSPSIGAALQDLRVSRIFSQSDRAALENGNALRLFPGVQKRLNA